MQAFPVYPAEIMARDLSYPGVGWLGHVGVTTAPFINQDAYQVYEALNENVVLQLNFMSDFMSRSSYWGSRYGIADRGPRAIRLLREASAQVCIGAEYTVTSYSRPATGDISTYPNCRAQELGLFRCDTFLVYIFGVAGYDITSSGRVSPAIVFAQFPNGNGDGPKALESNRRIKTSIKPLNFISDPIDSVTEEEIAAISPEELMELIDAPRKNIKSQTLLNIWKLSLNQKINSDKRLILMDYIGNISNIDMVSRFISQYSKIDNPEIRSMLLRNIQIIYQKYYPLNENPYEKELLQKFYNNLIDSKDLSIKDTERVTRGFIDLNSTETIYANFNKIDRMISKLDPYIQIGLKTNLLFKSKKLEKTIIPDLINMLNTQDNAQLDERFFLFIIDKLSRGTDKFDPSINTILSVYLDSVKYKFDNNKVSLKQNTSIFSHGAWLEASALINSNSQSEAGSYVAQFLGTLNSINERESYVIGLSNKDYMKKAFSKEPVLIEFKKQKQELYLNTVGTIPNKEKI